MSLLKLIIRSLKLVAPEKIVISGMSLMHRITVWPFEITEIQPVVYIEVPNDEKWLGKTEHVG